MKDNTSAGLKKRKLLVALLLAALGLAMTSALAVMWNQDNAPQPPPQPQARAPKAAAPAAAPAAPAAAPAPVAPAPVSPSHSSPPLPPPLPPPASSSLGPVRALVWPGYDYNRLDHQGLLVIITGRDGVELGRKTLPRPEARAISLSEFPQLREGRAYRFKVLPLDISGRPILAERLAQKGVSLLKGSFTLAPQGPSPSPPPPPPPQPPPPPAAKPKAKPTPKAEAWPSSPPPPPRGLKVRPKALPVGDSHRRAKGLLIAWRPLPRAGAKSYWLELQRRGAKKITRKGVRGPEWFFISGARGRRYRFRVRAVGPGGRESAPSRWSGYHRFPK